MGRNTSTEALILSTTSIGEDNRIITFLTPENGVTKAMLFGGRKSRLRSMVSPFNRGQLWLYSNPTNDTSKITDFNPIQYHLSFRESLYKIWAASLCAELLIKTHCGGEYKQSWVLSNAFLDGLEYSTENDCHTAVLRFLWRYSAILGIQPEMATCIHCGRAFDFSGKNGQYGVVYYPAGESGCVCSDCSQNSGEEGINGFILHKSSYDYLRAVSTLAPAVSRSISLSEDAFSEIQDMLFFLVSNAVDGKLKTLSSSNNFV